jgi:hypothetical protein
MTLEYITLVDSNKDTFNQNVNLYINNGYSLQGGLSITIEDDHVWYGQGLFINSNYNNYLTSTNIYYVIDTQNTIVNFIVGKNLYYITNDSVYVSAQRNSSTYFTGIIQNYNTITGDIQIDAENFFGSYDISSIFIINQNYYISSTTNGYLIDTTVHTITLIIGINLAYVTGNSVLVEDINNSNNYFIGTVINYDKLSGKIYLSVNYYIGTYELTVMYKININKYITNENIPVNTSIFKVFMNVNTGLSYSYNDPVIVTSYNYPNEYYTGIVKGYRESFLEIDIWSYQGTFDSLSILNINYNNYVTDTGSLKYIIDTTSTIQNFKVCGSLKYNYNDPVIVNDLYNQDNFFIGAIKNYNSSGDMQISVQKNNYFGTFGIPSSYCINYNSYTTTTIIQYLLNTTIFIVNFIVGVGFNYIINDPVIVTDLNNQGNYFIGTINSYNKIYGNMQIAVTKYYGTYTVLTSYIVDFNNYITSTVMPYLIDTTSAVVNFTVSIGLSYIPNNSVKVISQDNPSNYFIGIIINYNSTTGYIQISVTNYYGTYNLPSIFIINTHKVLLANNTPLLNKNIINNKIININKPTVLLANTNTSKITLANTNTSKIPLANTNTSKIPLENTETNNNISFPITINSQGFKNNICSPI